MIISPRSFRSKLMLFSACSLVCGAVPTLRAHAAPADGSFQVAQATAPATSITVTSDVLVKAKKRLLREKNSPSAVTELGKEQISAVGVSGSPQSLLRQAPSIYVYQQSLGDNAPVLTVRGLRGLEIATTLDGIPTQDLLAPGSFYLANNIGGVFTLGQISGVSIYPGVAYPDKNTFGTIGGTIAFDSKRPTDDSYIDVSGSAGMFGTYSEGIEVNSGSRDSVLGTGDNAIKVLGNYKNLQTQGFIDGTQSRENEFEFALDKPYNDGLSKFQATVLYNTANGLIENEPVPTPYLDKYGKFSNYPTNLISATEKNDYLTMILKDDTYINDYLNVGLTGFYLHNDNQLNDYGSYTLNLPGGVNGPLTIGGASPFINTPGGFGENIYYGPPVGGGGLGLFGGGTGGLFYGSGNHYNPNALYPVGSKYCPTAYSNIWLNSGAGPAPCGLNDQITGGSSDTYGIKPSLEIIAPELFGISNTIKIGGLAAKETSPTGYTYLGGSPNTPLSAANSAQVRTGGVMRTIYQGYAQDKVSFLDNSLHFTPGITVEGTKSSYLNQNVFGSANAPGIVGPNDINLYGYYKATKWDREVLPFFNASYDLDKIAPRLAGLSFYASYGDSALFAPVTDFGPNTAGPPPYASIVHMYEGGLHYDTSAVLIQADYFYQKIDRDFGFFSFQSGPQDGLTEYSGDGARETKGVEAAVTWQVTPDIQLFGNASHLLAKYLASGSAFTTVAEDQYGTAFKSDPVTGIPDYLATFGIDYTKKSFVKDDDSLDVRFSGQYTGHQFTTYDLSGTAYLDPSIKYEALAPLDYTGCTGVAATNQGCAAYTRYNQLTGATVYDPHGGLAAFTIFNIDLTYKLPTPELPVIKNITFNLNGQNIFNKFYYQYFYKQVSPSSCGTFTSGPFNGLTKNNYSCTPSFTDGIPGQPASVFLTVTARF